VNDFKTKTDEALMVLVRDHQSHQAYAELLSRHTTKFYATAFRQCGSRDEAEDAVQDSFIKLWSKPEMWKDNHKAKFTTWFYRIVINTTIDHMRRRKNHEGDDKIAMLPDKATDADNNMVQNQRAEELERAIQALPQRQKTALNLCVYEELSNKDAAKIMNVSIKGLESLLMRAKKTLRLHFERSEYNEQKTGGSHG
jgi:RNA polymerase sigma-70 factor (ECF subfamily)